MNLIAEIWDGKLPLVKVYWLYGVAVGAFFTILSLLIKDYPIALIVIAIALIPYQILVFVGIWRSADAYRDKKIWAILAKVHVVFGVIAALNGVASLMKSSTSDGSYSLSNCMQCKDGKCEPSTVWRSATVMLSPNENSMLVSNEFWGKDKDGKFESDITFNSKEKFFRGGEFLPSCAIKSQAEGFCKATSYEPTTDYANITENTFSFKDGKFVFYRKSQNFDRKTEMLAYESISSMECS
jgi:hypothetical protein